MTDLRDYIAQCENEGELHRITALVDWNLELAHTAKLNEERGGPALLFENVKDYSTPVLTSAFATTKRMAIALGQSPNLSMCDLARRWMELTTKALVKPKVVTSGPVLENRLEGEDVDILRFPSPQFYSNDGGRYLGTSAFLVTRDPSSGWVNLGTYRMMVIDGKRLAIQIIRGKHADMMMKQYQKMGKKMEAIVVLGGDPLLNLTGSTMVPVQTSEYDVVGQLRGEPVEIIESDLSGLPFPANAEIIIEGVIDPEQFVPEGPFGEYTGYYSAKEDPKIFLEISRVCHRNAPIFWATAVGKPINDVCMIQSLNRTASLWYDLNTMAIPGVKSVYIPPEACGRYWAIVSVAQSYPGHSMQVGTAVVSTTTGHYGLKGVIVVDEDIPADDWARVMWSLSVRYDPARSTTIISRGRSTPLDPSLPIEAREIVSRIILDACTPYEWKQKPRQVAPDEEILEQVKGRWEEFGLA